MKIPENAKSVFKGEIFEVFQWEQVMYDGSKATFEALKRADTVQILPVMDGKIILSYEEQPLKPRFFNFLGGRMEKGESPLDTAQRELLEEAGIAATEWKLYKVYQSKGKIVWNTYFYIAKNCRKVAEQNLDSGENIEVKKVDFSEFLEIVSTDEFWNSTIANDILRMRLDNRQLEAFKNELFS